MNNQHCVLSESELDRVVGGDVASGYHFCWDNAPGPGLYPMYIDCQAPPKTLGDCIMDAVNRIVSAREKFK
jgi:hypothetical protein